MLVPITVEYVNGESFIERKKVIACIDTGATQSGIDGTLAGELNFTTLGVTKQKTANGIMLSGIHTVNVELPNGVRFDDLETEEENPAEAEPEHAQNEEQGRAQLRNARSCRQECRKQHYKAKYQGGGSFHKSTSFQT